MNNQRPHAPSSRARRFTSDRRTPEVPRDIAGLVWYRPTATLEVDRDKRDVILCTMYLGDWDQWKWILKIYGANEVTGMFIRDQETNRMIPPAAARLWSIILGVPESRGPQRVRCSESIQAGAHSSMPERLTPESD